jgi:hypothetical protein
MERSNCAGFPRFPMGCQVPPLLAYASAKDQTTGLGQGLDFHFDILLHTCLVSTAEAIMGSSVFS